MPAIGSDYKTGLGRWLVRAVLGLAVAVFAATAPAVARDRFIFAWPSAINSGIAPLTFARELGYFEAENLDLEIQVLAGSGVIIPQLLAGTIHTAYASLEPLVIARQPGRPNFPLRFAYNFMRRSIWEFAVLENGPVRGLTDLRGRTIGVISNTSGNILMTRAILNNVGVPWGEVRVQAVGSGVPAFEALRTNQIQALNLWDTMHVAIELNGIPIRRLALPPQFEGLSSHGFPVTERLLASNPDLIARFGRAITKSTIACHANLQSCIRSYWRAYPALRPSTGTEEENLRREVAILTPRLENLMFFRPGESREFGAFADSDWTLLIEALRSGGEIQNTDVPLATLFTNALVPEFNRFDHASIIAQARAAR